MSDYTELKRLAEACVAAGEYLPGEAWEEDRSYCAAEQAFLAFVPVATPAAVLRMLNDIAALKSGCQLLAQDRNDARAERDQLKAENEALLVALKGMTSMYGYCWDIVDGGLLCMQDNVQRFEDAHEAAQKVIAAMGKGEQS